MAAIPSNMTPLGSKAPDFRLKNAVSGIFFSLEELKSDKATVIMFICNHCPFVKHINAGLVKFTKEYIGKGISFVGINSNDIEAYPEDSPENMKKVAEELGYPFPYLFDETQEVGHAYDAACTPDFYVYDKEMKLVYRGQFDDSRPSKEIPVTGSDLGAAIYNIFVGKPVNSFQKPSIGCSVKWKT